MKKLNKYKSQIYFHLIVNSLVGVFITFSSYYHLPLNYISDYSIYFIHFIILQFTVYGFLYLLSINKYLFYLTFPVLFFIYALFSYWVYVQDISISYSIVQPVIESKLDIALDLITTPFIIYSLIALLIIIYILKLYRNLRVDQLKSPLLILALIAIATFYGLNKHGIGNLKWRMPYNLTYGFIEYFNKPIVHYKKVNTNIVNKENDINIVFVLGESVRAKNLGINGYSRNTTPQLKKINNLISFPNVYTPLTYTGISVPQILSNKSIYKEQNSSNLFSIYSILNKVNFTTSWIGNQTPEKSYSFFIDENDNIEFIDQFHDVFSFQKKLDEEMLPFLESKIKNGTKNFITLHMIGSHWWYEARYSKKYRKYTPVIDSKHIPALSNEQIINSYDNTILYLDNFLNNVIHKIKKSKSKTILIYLSDHGEILGENGKWLHAQGDDASTNPAMFIWYSDSFKQTYPEKIKNLQLNASKQITTDFFFHSILDLIEIQNFNYEKSQSIFEIVKN
ncbi:phosphoethanolamine transferase [Lutibacter sp. HS1-25]|uniref:phosphoethanolamine transferase n=1 Tax=Lutibacter sp. HS1-25 TaxID=2485000 RepID=UPI001013C2E5|nr:phosphoethanolamine transferase [Lutibacter sp. HS1-25]RXP45875.1 phosphoethanolamine transferase [Lutibacter sp. HS1-25]